MLYIYIYIHNYYITHIISKTEPSKSTKGHDTYIVDDPTCRPPHPPTSHLTGRKDESDIRACSIKTFNRYNIRLLKRWRHMCTMRAGHEQTHTKH